MSEGKTVEVKSRPRPAGLTQIPEAIQQEMEAKGMHVFLASNHANVVAQRSARGAWPLLVDDLDETAVDGARRMGFRREPDGTLRRGDCILYAQSAAERDANRAQDLVRLMNQESAESVFEEIEDMNQRIRASGGAQGEVVPENVKGVREHVTNPSSLFERIRSGLTAEE